VTLVEQYVPGTVRSASGGDTRILRAAHGGVDWYADLVWDARRQWLELQERRGVHIWEPIGVAWFATRPDAFEARSRPAFDRLGIPYEWLSPEEARGLFPSLGIDDLEAVLFEPDAGVLLARRATQLLVEDARDLGVRLETAQLSADDPPRTDVVVWACGAWLPRLFPDLVDLTISRREVFFLGAPGAWDGTPGFCDYDRMFYGRGEVGGLGMKIAPDQAGPDVDPETLVRIPSADGRAVAQAYAALRFPALADVPVIGGRVCQYSLTSDTHFLVDRHPERDGWWLIGGGSGHGFKHGPALGDYVADCVEGGREPEPFHALGERAGNAGLRTSAIG
jgi:glycine/D-amino acid oxidase-like deaminating enzyme